MGKKEPASTVAVAESLDSIGHCLVVARLCCWLAVKNNIVFFLNFSSLFIYFLNLGRIEKAIWPVLREASALPGSESVSRQGAEHMAGGRGSKRGGKYRQSEN